MERIQKFLARAGVASRRRCEDLVAAGRVAVNGVTVRAMGVSVDPERDIVAVDGLVVHAEQDHVYLAVNKPRGYVTTVSDTHGRPTVMDLAPEATRRIYPVGRLDKESEGLLILTDDGDLAFGLMHPSRGVPKTYVVKLGSPASRTDLESLAHGIELDDGPTRGAKVRIVGDSRTVVEVEIREGRKRQVRRMFAALGNSVVSLTRIKLGCVELGSLESGSHRRLTGPEVEGLKKLAAPAASLVRGNRVRRHETRGEERPYGDGEGTCEVRLQRIRKAGPPVHGAQERCRDVGGEPRQGNGGPKVHRHPGSPGRRH